MAPIILVMALLGIAAKIECASPWLREDVNSLNGPLYLGIQSKFMMLTQICHNRPDGDAPSAQHQLLDVICPAFTGEGSGEGSGDVPNMELDAGENWIYSFENIAEYLLTDEDDGFQQILYKLAEGACQAAERTGFGNSDIEAFCRSKRRRIDGDDGHDLGSGDVITASGADNDGDDDYYYVLSTVLSADVDGLENDPFYFTNNAI